MLRPNTVSLSMSPKPEVAEIVVRWLDRADAHIAAARVLVRSAEADTHDAACYHAHEAAATLIKAILTGHGIVAPRIHDLEFLHRLIPEPSRFDADPAALAWLSAYGIERWWEPDGVQARQALELVEVLRTSAGAVVDANFLRTTGTLD
jgi:HEPN domain-containing protein